ncbi:DNA-methyltransferase [Clostridium paraputrificum]|uniref:DNA-methyltransferase n=1 Tax=Clostridium paraputrificum TaxID=29363 RepID=UPI00189CB6A8|nr:site-specific DNA-methyltransferase [Clostridium paraputrificum]
MKDIANDSINLIVTDPPYKTITGGNSDGVNSKRPQGMLEGNRKLFKYQKLNISDWMSELYRVLKDGSHCYIMTNSLNMEEMLVQSRKVGFKLHNILVWEKNNCTPSQFYMKNCEYTLFLRKGKAKWINDIGGSKTVHKFNNIIGKKTHPCEKPTDLLQFYISNSIQDKNLDVVFDPFMGTGSCGIACCNLGIKNFIGIELDDTYFEIAKNRIKNYKNKPN